LRKYKILLTYIKLFFYREYLTCMNERDTTIGKGFRFLGNHFDVHRFHPPLVYGRRGGPEGGPEECEGICCSRVNITKLIC